MEVMQEVLAHVLGREELVLALMDWDPQTLAAEVNQVTVEALEAIASALMDESHSDENCIDHIVYILKSIGIDCGKRHSLPYPLISE